MYLCLAALLTAGVTEAQITVGEWDVVPNPMRVTQNYDLASTVNPGVAGMSQTWDFSTLENEGSSITDIQAAGWIEYGNLFPESQYGVKEGDSTFVFFAKNSSHFAVNGVVQDVDGDEDLDVLKFEKPLIETSFPIIYGNTYSDTGIVFVSVAGDPLQGYDSAHFQQIIIRNLVTDAYGQMILPMGTFDVLRNNGKINVIDSTWIFLGGVRQLVDNNSDSENFYEWYTDNNAANYQLVEMGYDSATGAITDVLYLAGTPTVGVIEKELSAVSIFPNPSKGLLTIELEASLTNATLVVLDVRGALVSTGSINGLSQKMDLTHLSNGLYYVQVIDAAGNLVAKEKFMMLK